MRTSSLAFTILLVFFAAGAARGAGPERLDELDLGEQVSGPTLSRLDLEGRIVVCFQWCVSCPISTGTFPFVNELVRKYEDRGVRVIGFQVRRRPEVAPNDVRWYLAHLGPGFPVVRLASEWDWPQPYLPWAVVFDHRGERVFTGSLQQIEPLLDDLTAKAPDWLVGGPYEHIAEAAAEIVFDRAHAGRYLPAIREIAAREGGNPDARAEAGALLAHVNAWFERQVEKAETDVWSVVEGAEILLGLAARFQGDALGDRARERVTAITSDPAYPLQIEAWAKLTAARAAHFLLPPPGAYVYHPTEMIYRDSDDPALVARRARMLAEFRLALRRIERDFPDTDAAAIAGDLLLTEPAVEIEEEEAAARIERASALLEGEVTEAGLAEAWLALAETAEGRPEGDATGASARERMAAIEADRGEELSRALDRHADRNERVRALIGEIEAGGSALPRAEADEIAARLHSVAKEAGRGSELHGRVLAYLRALDESFAGPAQLGVAFDGRYEGDGVRIGGVYPRTAAAIAGLRAGDVIVAFDGGAVADAEGFRAAITGHRPGERVSLTVRRAGEGGELAVTVVLGRRVP